MKQEVRNFCQRDLKTVFKTAFELSMKEFVIDPYTYLVQDYIEKSKEESDLLDERFEELS